MNNINEECGVFGVFNCENAAEITYYGLHALQHRGQEGCGICTTNGTDFYRERGEGLVTEIFNKKNLAKLKGNCAIGHVRYSTAGGGGIDNVQPFLFRHHTGDFSIAHNGNLVNSRQLKMSLEAQGSIFQSSSDTEVLAHLMKMNRRRDRIEVIEEALNMIEGAYAFLILTNDKLYVCRDKNGLRPVSIGRLNGGYVISSETCALEAVGATFVRDVAPGEMVIFDKGKEPENILFAGEYSHKICAMEFVYFARPDSEIEGMNVHTFRKNCGKYLARLAPVDADLVIGVPDSSISGAIGYAEESNIPYEIGLIKNKYVGRTFIQPSQELREKGVRLKLGPVRSLIAGKRVILLDDSIVRGTTCKHIVRMLKEAGAQEVHVRICCPPMRHPCFYGVDTSTYEELISAQLDVEEVRQMIEADSLFFLPEEYLLKAGYKDELCLACYNGKYPTHLYQSKGELNIEHKF
ncbi:MAG: amidophosphoribosyltransferase [Bacteroidetes bacterium]|nr:amidophosphoribosyltransferase [Bacteroidota bacterium]MCL1969110.1 amidophosphoribosyltransferase [Bacteroidota bacterium]